MRIAVRFFAIQRVQTGVRSHGLELAPGSDVAAAWDALVSEFPAIEPAASSVRFARNGRYVDRGEPLDDGDELAVIPPVAGGSGGSSGESERLRRIEIREDALDAALIAELHEVVPSDADGAVAVFVGRTRETPGTPAPGQESIAARFAGALVQGLDYEAFEPMVLSVLDQIADEVDDRYGVRRVAIIHRIGSVAVGEASVIIAAAAPHRDEAFAACRYVIEELKARAPIWKAERFRDGRVWMGSPARSGPEVADDS